MSKIIEIQDIEKCIANLEKALKMAEQYEQELIHCEIVSIKKMVEFLEGFKREKEKTIKFKKLNNNLIELNKFLIDFSKEIFNENKKLIEKNKKIINEFENKICEKLHKAEMHGNYEPEVTTGMFYEVLDEIRKDLL